jgi:hypothetical protein
MSVRRIARWVARIALGIVAVPTAYVAAAVLLGLVPANVAWHPPDQGITIYVRTNGVHTGILMPARIRYI